MEENETLEFKRSTSELKEAIISIVAILNKHQNGRLIFGVKNDGRVIADMFHEVHFVEKWGRGISLILDKEPDADFEVVAGIFVTTFKRKHYVPSPAQKTVEKTRVEKFGEKFGENELKVIVLLKQNSKITVLELARKVGITTRGIEKILQRLKEKSIIKIIGPAKGGHWEVLQFK